MGVRMPGPIPYYKKAKAERINKGLTQSEAGQFYRKSQSFIARLESGGLNDVAEEKRYYLWLKKRRRRRDRFTGGRYRVGPKRHRAKDPKYYRGEPLQGDDFYRDKLKEQGWSLLALTRTADDMDLAFAYRGDRDEFAMIGFVKKNGSYDLEMQPPIRFSSNWDDNSGDALEAFGAGRFPDAVYDQAMAEYEETAPPDEGDEESEDDEGAEASA